MATGVRVVTAARATALMAGRAGAQGTGTPKTPGLSWAALGIRTLDGATGKATVEWLIAAGGPASVRRKRTLYTSRADQTRLVLDVVQGDARGQEAGSARFEYGPLQGVPKNAAVAVSLGYDEKGILSVSVLDPKTWSEVWLTQGASSVVSDDSIWQVRLARINDMAAEAVEPGSRPHKASGTVA